MPWGMGMDAAGGMPAKKQKTGGGGNVKCSTHGKMRSEMNMTEDGMGGYCCNPDSECQTGGGGGGGGMAVCSTHQKQRSGAFLTDDGNGGMCCMPGSECQVGSGASGGAPFDNTKVQCSVHGKERGMSSCVDDGQGGYQCSPGNECQMGGGGGGSGKAKGKAKGSKGKGKANGGGKGEMCGDFKNGNCSRGDSCRFSHGQGSSAGDMMGMMDGMNPWMMMAMMKGKAMKGKW